MARYFQLFWVQLRASLAVAMQYRSDFLVQGGISAFWALMTLVPLQVVFQNRDVSIAGWSYGEVLVVIGWFTLVKSFLDGAIHPSLMAVVEHVRKGTLDFVLMKPADAQFLVSTAKFEPWKVADTLAAFGIFAYGFYRIGRLPQPAHVLFAVFMLFIALTAAYAIWITVIAAAFYVVKVDNLSYLFVSVFEAARWPVNIFNGALRVVFTFVVPLALMTTFPAMALLGTLTWQTALGSLAGAVAMFVVSRLVWVTALGKYTSASS